MADIEPPRNVRQVNEPSVSYRVTISIAVNGIVDTMRDGTQAMQRQCRDGILLAIGIVVCSHTMHVKG